MACKKRFHLVWIRLARFGIGFRCNHLVVKSFRAAKWKHGKVDHRSSPKFAIWQGELKPQAAHSIRRVGRIGLATPQREAADHGHAPLSKDECLRETDAIPIAFKEPGYAHSLGMIAPKTRVRSIDFLKTIDET